MARKRRQEEPENLERWLVSYADFITLLFAFFVVMYAISSVNEGKYRVLSDTMEAAFNNRPINIEPVPVKPDSPSPDPSVLESSDPVPRNSPIIEMLQETAKDNALGEIADDFEQAFSPLIEQDLINIDRNDLWVEIEINTSLLFRSGEAELEEVALPVLSKIAGILQRYPNFIQVEGYTDNLPINTYMFPSNWELSSARAASVVHVFMNNGVRPDKMAAIGYGEYRPITDNATAEGRRSNRRVVLAILADAKARRALDIKRNTRPLPQTTTPSP